MYVINSNSAPNLIAARTGFKRWNDLPDTSQVSIREFLPECDDAELSKYWWRYEGRGAWQCHNPAVSI